MGGVFAMFPLFITAQNISSTVNFRPTKLVVRLNHKLLNYSRIDDASFLQGSLVDFLNEQGKESLIKLDNSPIKFGELKVSKLFSHLKVGDSISISRTGEKIYIPPFWATFHVQIPQNMDHLKLTRILKSAYPLVIYVDPPMKVVYDDIPNDSLFSYQESLYSFNFPEGHINIDSAWNIETGRKFIKVGVFDSGIDANHPDLEVLGGYQYSLSTSLFGEDIHGHGTSVAGIIGAKRNNGIGVSGIAGGNGIDTTGISIVDLNRGSGSFFSIEYLAMSIIDASRRVSTYYDWTNDNNNTLPNGDAYWNNASGFGIHVGNHSYSFFGLSSLEIVPEELPGSDTVAPPAPINVSICNLCREAFLFSLKNGVVNITSRGNNPNASQTMDLTYPFGGYPQSYDDSWVIVVGASGTDGKRLVYPVNTSIGEIMQSPIGNNLDLIAPGARTMITTTRSSNLPNTDIYGLYRNFNATSAAAPHVSGVAALLLSHYNKPCYSNINLDPADVEYILQASARDVNPYVDGYDDSTGYGLLDAYQALKMIQFPEYQIVHPNEPYIDVVLVEQDTISFYLDKPLNPEYNGPLGSQFPMELEQNYLVERRKYSVKYVIDQYMLPGTTLLDAWVRHSRTNSLGFMNDTIGGYEYIGNTGNTQWVSRPDTLGIEPMAQIVSIVNDSIVELEGYYYHFIRKYDNNGITGGIFEEDVIDYWYPINPATDTIRMAFSIYLHNPYAIERWDFPCDSVNLLLDTLLNLAEESWNEMELYPNPGKDQLTIRLKNKVSSGQVYLSDLTGKLIQQEWVKTSSDLIKLDLLNINPGIYFVTIQDERGSRLTKRWIRL